MKLDSPEYDKKSVRAMPANCAGGSQDPFRRDVREEAHEVREEDVGLAPLRRKLGKEAPDRRHSWVLCE